LTKFLNKIFFLGFFYGTSFALAQSSPLQAGEAKEIFGYTFIEKQSFGTAKNYYYEDTNDIVRVKLIQSNSEDKADTYIKDKLALFKSIFEAKRVDYPGQHSKVIECPAEYMPQFSEKLVDGGKLSYFIGYANKNQVTGICASDLLYYKHFYGFLSCKNTSTVYEIEDFSSLNAGSLNNLINAITCKK
jgi:hypothetical protein